MTLAEVSLRCCFLLCTHQAGGDLATRGRYKQASPLSPGCRGADMGLKLTCLKGKRAAFSLQLFMGAPGGR